MIRHQTIPIPGTSIYGTLHNPTSNNPPPDTSVYETLPSDKQSPVRYINLWTSLPPDIKRSPPDTLRDYRIIFPPVQAHQFIELYTSQNQNDPIQPYQVGELFGEPAIKQSPSRTHTFMKLLTTRHQSIRFSTYHFMKLFTIPHQAISLKTHQFMELVTIRHQTIPSRHINLWISLPPDIRQSSSRLVNL